MRTKSMTFSNSEAFIMMTECKKILQHFKYPFIDELQMRINLANKHQRQMKQQNKDDINRKIEMDKYDIYCWTNRCRNGFTRFKPSIELSNVYSLSYELDINLSQSLNFVQSIRFNKFNNLSYGEEIDSAYVHLKHYKKYHKQLKWVITHPKLPFIEELFEQANHPKRMEYKFSICNDMDYVFDNM